MVASRKGKNQYSIRKKIYEKIRIMGNIKAMSIAFFQKEKSQKKKITIPKISRTFQAQAIQKPKIKIQY